MKTFDQVAALLSAVLILLTLTACSQNGSQTTAPPIETVSEQAVEFVNQAIENYAKDDFHSTFVSRVDVMATGGTTPVSGYGIKGENLILNSGADAAWMIDLYVDYDRDPTVSSDPIYFSTCYLYNKTVYHQYDKNGASKEENYFVGISYDDLSRMGLYSLGEAIPSSCYAVKQGSRLRVDLHFSAADTAKMQEAMIRQLLDGVFEDDTELALVFSDLTFSAMIDAESNRLQNYSLAFTATSPQFEEGAELRFSYTETFTDYDVTGKIDYPDFSGYVDKTPKT